MEKFSILTSQAVSYLQDDVNTDMIIPAQFLTSIERSGYGAHLFAGLRQSFPDFPLNNPAARAAQILVTGENFGCGSSREHAVWALQDWGFRVVIAPSFADIFANNSAKNGLLLITLPRADLNRISELIASNLPVMVNLPNQLISLGTHGEFKFCCEPFRKHCLLNGLDDFSYLTEKHDIIEEYFRQHNKTRFFSTLKPHYPTGH